MLILGDQTNYCHMTISASIIFLVIWPYFYNHRSINKLRIIPGVLLAILWSPLAPISRHILHYGRQRHLLCDFNMGKNCQTNMRFSVNIACFLSCLARLFRFSNPGYGGPQHPYPGESNKMVAKGHHFVLLICTKRAVLNVCLSWFLGWYLVFLRCCREC